MRGSRRDPRSGIALIWVVVAMVLLMAGILAAFEASERARRSIEMELQYDGQAMNIARAGIADALSWFRRQTTQPVQVFAPRRDLAAIPPVNETDDPAIGLVRSIEVSAMNRVWARYEVRIDRIQDVSAMYDESETGVIWQIESVGIIYVQENAALAFDAWPNQVRSRVRVQTEIRRLSINPGQAAICTSDPGQCTMNARTKILGGGSPAILYYSAFQPPPRGGVPSSSGTIQGTPIAIQPDPTLDITCKKVFGIEDNELRSTADVYTSDATTITSPLPSYKIVYVDGNITFNAARPLEGTGVLVVNGQMTVSASSNSVFNGLIFCTGDVQINAPTLIRGVIIGSNRINCVGTGDYVEIDYDPDILADLRSRMGQYRFSKSIRVVE